jgi:hypothetical protein
LSHAAAVGRALLDLLAGRSPTFPSTPPIEELLERHASGDVVADDVITIAHAATLASRVDAAVNADAIAVPLADGSTLSVEQAERQLAHKEERRVYLPLRTPLERAVARTLRPVDAAFAFARALPVDPGVVVADHALARLRAFVDRTSGVASAARDFLERDGGAPLVGEAALRRALDLPGPAAFAADPVFAAVRLALSTSTPARRPTRTPAPRALCGHVVDDGTTPRLLASPCSSAGRHLALARGAGVIVALALAGPDHAAGLGLGLIDAATRRALDQSRDDARRAFSVTAATAVLVARARASVAVASARPFVGEGALDELREVTRGACRAGLLSDAGAVFVEALLAPPWPDGTRLSVPAVAAVDDAIAAAHAARSWLYLRDAFDEGFVARGGGLRALRELPAPSTTKDGDGVDDARAWDALLGEFL